MRPPEDSRGLTVVGRFGADAAATFGPAFKDARSVSYEQFPEDSDLDEVRAVALADDPSLSVVLPGVLERRASLSFDVLVEVGPLAGDSLAGLLADSLHTGITRVDRGTGNAVLHLGNDGVSGRGVRVLLDALHIAPPAWEDEPDSEGTDSAASLPAWAVSRPRQRAALAGLALLVVGVLVLFVIGRSDAGTAGVLITLGFATVLAQGLTLVAAVLLLRRAARYRAVDIRFRDELRPRMRRLVDQSGAVRSEVQGLVLGADRARKWRNDEVRRESTRERRSQWRHLQTERQVQALLNLDKLVRIEAAVPPMGGWAASPDLLVLCVQALLEERPQTLVECGSGVSTLMLALAAEQHDLPTRIVALEHDAHFADGTRRLLERHGVGGRAEVRLAPLKPVDLPGHETPWYDSSALSDLEEIGMLLVDGPPGATGPEARYPAMPLLRERLSSRCLVVMDDLNRTADLEVAERWNAEMDDFDLDVVGELQKKVGLLTRG